MRRLGKQERKTVAVMFGGNSAEHEISIITALQAISAIDSLAYRVVPIYLSLDGLWYTGAPLLQKKSYSNWASVQSELAQVSLRPHPQEGGFCWVKGAPFIDRLWGRSLAVDVCLLCFHGQQGENGCVQGLLELAGIPYTGCSVVASALAMDKYLCKGFLQSHGIPVLPSQLVKRKEAIDNLQQVCDKILSTPGLEQFPLFVKPCNLGSSIGISKAHDRTSLLAAIAKAMRYDDEVIVEPCLERLMEINVSVIENGLSPIASAVEVPLAERQILTFEDKYLRGGGKKGGPIRSGMAALTRLIDPENLNPSIKTLVQAYAVEAFSLLKGAGVSRLDFMYDLEKERLYFNEINPIPGSLAFYLWEKSSPRLLYSDLLSHLIESAIKRKQEKLALETCLEFRALK